MPNYNERVNYEFTADNKSLAKTISDNIDLLDAYGKRLTKFASESLAATTKEVAALEKQVTKTTSVATNLTSVFSDFKKQVDKFSTGFNWMDEAISKQEKLTKSAKDSADVFRKAYAEQNKFNAGAAGRVNIDSASKSAKESAEAFNQFFGNESTQLGSAFSKIASFFGKTQGSISAAAASAASFGAKLQAAAATAQQVYNVAKKISTVVLKITSTVTKFVTSPLKLLQSGFSQLSKGIAGANGELRTFSNLLGIGAGAGIGYMLSESAKGASDMIEASNLFNQVMKQNVETGNKWVATLSEMSGMDITNLKSITGLFYEMGAAVDMPSEAASKLSQDLTELSLDISSLFNVDLDTVTNNITSGIRGMSRAVVKYGMDIRASTVEAFARTTYGITEQYETMNETNRVILRYLLMLKQAEDANGDLSRTIEQPANQLRVFKQQVIGFGREFGRFIISIIEPALPVLNGIAMALRNITKFVADFLGMWSGEAASATTSNTEDIATGISGIGDSASGATKSLKKFLAPFDELNIISDNMKSSGSGGSAADYGIADPRLLQALDEAETKFGKIEMAAHKVRDAVLEFFGFEYVFDQEGNIDEYIRMIPGEFADSLAKAFKQQDFSAVGSIIANKLNPVITSIADKFSWNNVGPAIRRNLSALTSAINTFLVTLDWNSVGQIFGNLLKTAFETFNYFSLTFNWTALGAAIASSLNGFFEAFDVSTVGVTLANVLNKIADFASGFAKTFNWVAFGQQLSSSINKFFKTWDAAKFGEAASSIVLGLVSMINRAISTTNWALVGQKIATFLKSLKWGEILAALGTTIWNALKAAVIAAVSGASTLATGNASSAAVASAAAAASSTTRRTRTGYSTRPFATGGVVTGPTRALIGEAGKAEMVMPLDNSPQMTQFISQIADAVKGNNAQPVEVHVYLDSKAIASGMYDELQNVEFRRGTSLIR